MRLESRILENRFVRLEPLGEAHREDLRMACAEDPEIWSKLYSISMIDEGFTTSWAWLMGEAESGGAICYAVVVDGRCGGMTCCLRVDGSNANLEIGATYYAPRLRGGPVNPAAKRLLLAHAFEAGARRVFLTVDALNTRSRAAVLKLGAVQEGILRQERVVWTGRVRDTVVFSILADEWPAVREGLDARLAAFG